MTGSEFTQVYWPWIIGAVGVLNPCFMLPQLIKIWRTSRAEDVSLMMLSLLMLVQFAFAIHGYIIDDQLLVWSNSAAGMVTVATAVSAMRFSRHI